jgi:hypothetical protein
VDIADEEEEDEEEEEEEGDLLLSWFLWVGWSLSQSSSSSSSSSSLRCKAAFDIDSTSKWCCVGGSNGEWGSICPSLIWSWVSNNSSISSALLGWWKGVFGSSIFWRGTRSLSFITTYIYIIHMR